MNRTTRIPAGKGATIAWFVACCMAAVCCVTSDVERATSEPVVGQQMALPPDRQTSRPGEIQLCQALGPAAPCDIEGVDCSQCERCHRIGWRAMGPIPFQMYAQGEYVGHERTAHVPEYRLRVDDQIEFIYRVTRDETSKPYELNVGDEIIVESFTDPNLNKNLRTLIVQPDGTITLPLLGQVRATRRTIDQLRIDLNKLYEKYYKSPEISVTPIKVNTKLEDLRATIDSRAGQGGQRSTAKVTPEGTVGLPAIGSVMAQGLTLTELKREIDERYAAEIEGIEVTPVLLQRAPRFVYVLGEVQLPGRFELSGPTTVTQAIAMAGSWKIGANLHQIVIFRRGDDWRLMATMVNLEGALAGKKPCPAGEIWIDDSDIVIVPKSFIQHANDFIEMVFTRGIYGVIPNQGISLNIDKLNNL